MLDGATLTLHRGEKGLLLGSNGAGKSTLLRVIAGLLSPDAGCVSIDGIESARDRRAVAALIGYAGHAALVYVDLTAEENLRFAAGLYGLREEAAASRVEASLALVGLTEQRGKRTRTLSQGQLRRLALARALVHDPPVLLLDEPFAALDAEGRGRLVAWLAADRECTVLLATHQLDFRPEGADQIFHLDAGRIRAHPGHKSATSGKALLSIGAQNARAAGMISHMNGRLLAAMECVRLIAAKDLRIEWRSRVALNQVLPFAAIVMVIFAFALDRFPNPPAPGGARNDTLLQQVAPGLVWLATLFSLLLLVQRTFAVESEDGALDALRAAGVDAGAVFWGKTAALAAQLAVLEALLLGTAAVIYAVELRWSGVVLLLATWLAATVGLAAVGTLYGGLAAGARGRETLLPLLLLPVVAPVLIGATRAVEAALGIGGTAIADGWPWVGVVSVFAVAFGAGGTLAFGPLIDE